MTALLALLLASPPPYVERDLPTRPEVAASVTVAACVADVDPLYLLASVRAESSERVHVRGDQGRAWGLYQIHVQYASRIAPWLYQDWRDPVQQGLLAGAVWARLIARYGRGRAARVYACGWLCRPGWTTPPRWGRELKRLVGEPGGVM